MKEKEGGMKTTKVSAHRKLTAWILGTFILMVFIVLFTGGEAQAAMGGNAGPEDQLAFDPASDTEGNHCLTPSGVDLNTLLGVSEQILFSAGRTFCLSVSSGEFYIPFSVLWNVNSAEGIPGFPLVYPEGYTPAKPAPIDDFISKASIEYIVDEHKTYLFPGEDVIKVVPFNSVRPGNPPFLSSISVAKLHPVSVGDHTVTVILRVSAQHCDGLGTDATPGVSCLYPNVDFPIRTLNFEVVPGAAQSQ
jgi:hypothetical protein